MKKLFFLQVVLALFLGFTPESSSQYCLPFEYQETDFQSNTRFAKAQAERYHGWVEYHGGGKVYPESLMPLSKWNHPFMDENTMVTLSFGRANTTLLLVDIKDTLKLLDAIPIPGRGHKAAELASKKARMALFRNTSGGAYFFLSKNNEVIIPGPDYRIFYIPVRDRSFVRSEMVSYEILEEIKKGECPKTYSHLIGEFGVLKKIEKFFGKKYDQKVFNNIWATYAFGPKNSIYILEHTGAL
jgi:hypothetical protein